MNFLNSYNLHVLLPLLQFVYPLVGLNQYTNINLLWFALSLVWPQLSPFVFVNSVAISASFYTGMVMLNEADMARLLENRSFMLYQVGSIVVHILPACITWHILPNKVPIYTGFITLFHHLAWGFSKSSYLCLDTLYIPMSPFRWSIMWCVSSIAHIVSPFIFFHK